MKVFRTIFVLAVAIAVAASQESSTVGPTEEPTEEPTEGPTTDRPSTVRPTDTTTVGPSSTAGPSTAGPTTSGPSSTSGSSSPTTVGPSSTAGSTGSPTTPNYDTCDEGDDGMYPPDCPTDSANGTATYFPYPYDCTKYFECTNGVAKCIQCALGTVWDQELTTCNHEAVVPCVIITTQPTTPTTPTTTTPTTTTPTTTTPTTTTPTTTTPTTTTPTTTTPTTTTESEVTDPADWVCPEGYVGRMRHPYICEQFYICDPGRRPCLFDCQNGLYYNPITLDCDWPENVPDCVNGTPPPPVFTTTPGTNYRTARRSHNSVKDSFFSFFSIFEQDTTTERGPCDEPWFKEEYDRIH